MIEFKECEECYGWCCSDIAGHFGTPLHDDDVKRISEYLNISEKDFRVLYVMNVYGIEAIIPASPCPFWKNCACEIHEVKPRTCAGYFCGGYRV